MRLLSTTKSTMTQIKNVYLSGLQDLPLSIPTCSTAQLPYLRPSKHVHLHLKPSWKKRDFSVKMANFNPSSTSSEEGDKYRSFISGEGEKNTKWLSGAPPNFEVVNELFEKERTRVWPPGSLEERVQRIVKTLEMELVHKPYPEDLKSVDPFKFSMSVNGGEPMTLKRLGEIGGGNNAFLQTSLPKELRVYDPEKETAESSETAFKTAFPRGFALEVLEVFSGPPRFAFKFRHWAYKEGPFKGYAPTGDLVEFFGMAVYEVNEEMKIVKVEFFFDPGQLLGSLIKGAKLDDDQGNLKEMLSSCPVMGA